MRRYERPSRLGVVGFLGRSLEMIPGRSISLRSLHVRKNHCLTHRRRIHRKCHFTRQTLFAPQEECLSIPVGKHESNAHRSRLGTANCPNPIYRDRAQLSVATREVQRARVAEDGASVRRVKGHHGTMMYGALSVCASGFKCSRGSAWHRSAAITSRDYLPSSLPQTANGMVSLPKSGEVFRVQISDE